jgi:hypothetical protein
VEINELTAAERRVWEAYPYGEGVDFRAPAQDGPANDPAHGQDWGPERTVRASVVKHLLLSAPEPRTGSVPALHLRGARLTGSLNLRHGHVGGEVWFEECFVEGHLNLRGAQLRQLDLGGSVLRGGLTAASARIEGTLRMSGCRVRGALRLNGVQVGGAVFLDGAVLRPGEGGAEPEPVLQLTQASLGHALSAPGLDAEGTVQLAGAVVAGEVRLDDARLHAPDGGTALDAVTLSVGTDVHATRLRARGRVNLRGARIPGQLNLGRARLSNPGGVALRASSCTIGELWLRDADPIEGAVDLRRSQLDLLHIAPGTWPGEVSLDGLGYAALAPHEPAERRLPVLARESDGYVPYSYEQLTAAYRRIGDDQGARTVQLAKQRRHRATLPWYARAWGLLQDVTVGYGFRPMRAAVWLLSLLLAASAVYAAEEPRPLKAGEAPAFSPVFYSLDLLLPIIDFGQERAFVPTGWHQGLAYALIIAGWVLATTVVAGVTRSVSRH